MRTDDNFKTNETNELDQLEITKMAPVNDALASHLKLLRLLEERGFPAGYVLPLAVSFKYNGFSKTDIDNLNIFFESGEPLPEGCGQLMDLDDLRKLNLIINRKVIQHRGWFEEIHNETTQHEGS